MKSTALSILFGVMLAVSAHATPITTWTFDYTGYGNDANAGTVVTGDGVFTFDTGLTTVTRADLLSYSYAQDYNFSGCTGMVCGGAQNFNDAFALSDVTWFSFTPSNPGSLEIESDLAYDIFNTAPVDGMLGAYTDQSAAYGLITNLTDPPSVPEPGTILLFSLGLLIVSWLTKRANRSNI